jgi:hypothetical protein
MRAMDWRMSALALATAALVAVVFCGPEAATAAKAVGSATQQHGLRDDDESSAAPEAPSKSSKPSKAKPKKPKAPALAVPQRCPKGHREVADAQCCPDTEPLYHYGKCFPLCDDGHDEMTVGDWAGCRELCEPGYASTLNTCSRGPVTSERKDVARTGVPTVPQYPWKVAPEDTLTKCRKKYIRVAYNHDGTGGCCPVDKPNLVNDHCYPDCDKSSDPVTIGAFVGCRNHCPSNSDQTFDSCKHGSESTDREDFPRHSVAASRRLIGKPGKEPVRWRAKRRNRHSSNDPTGCPKNYVKASKSQCCPSKKPILIGALCYADCPDNYAEVGFACRMDCPKGYTNFGLTCTKGAKTIIRKGYERAPDTPKPRKKT